MSKKANYLNMLWWRKFVDQGIQHWHDEHGHEGDHHAAEDGDGHGDHEVGAASGRGGEFAALFFFVE